MDLQTLAAIIGILSGLVTLVGGVAGAVGRMRAPAQVQAPRVPIQAGAYPYPPPTSNVSGPYPQSGGSAPPAGYRWPGAPQPGAAQPGYPQAPQRGAPAQSPGYGAAPGQWGNVQQPVTPYPIPQQNPYAPYAPQSALRRWFPYPWIAIGAALVVTFSGIYASMGGGNGADTPAETFMELVALIFYIPTVVVAARQAIKIQRWGWLVSIILIFAYGMLAFGAFGPTTPPQPKTPSYPQYPPRRM